MRAKTINEDITDLFKPKSKEELESEFAKIHPDFVELAKEFNNGEYNIERSGDYIEGRFIFDVKEKGKEYIFLVDQLSYYKNEPPRISYLDKSKTSHIFRGVFTNQSAVRNKNSVYTYVQNIIKRFK